MRLGIMLAALVLTSVSSTPALCQSAGEPFTFVAVGQNITVRKADGEVVRGRVTRADKEGILVDGGKKQGTLQVGNSDIVKIGRKSRVKGTLVGSAVGFIAGFAVAFPLAGQIMDENNVSVGRRAAAGAGFGLFTGGIGAGIGAATGAEATIYRRR